MSTLLFFGDIVGEPGRKALLLALPELRAEFCASFIIVNGENAAGGRGITPKIAQEFLRAGIDVITLGDHVWDQTDLVSWLPQEPRVLRPFNLQEGSPGAGSVIVDTPEGKVAVLSAQGRTFMRPSAENPFQKLLPECERLRELGARVLFVDFHAETTSEKVAMGYHLDGQVSAVVGTHTHVQTSDARVLPAGTAYLTDAGMCGTLDGVIGREASAVLSGLTSGIPAKLPIGGWPAQVCGVAVSVDWETGRATAITPFSRVYEKP